MVDVPEVHKSYYYQWLAVHSETKKKIVAGSNSSQCGATWGVFHLLQSPPLRYGSWRIWQHKTCTVCCRLRITVYCLVTTSRIYHISDYLLYNRRSIRPTIHNRQPGTGCDQMELRRPQYWVSANSWIVCQSRRHDTHVNREHWRQRWESGRSIKHKWKEDSRSFVDSRSCGVVEYCWSSRTWTSQSHTT